MKGTSSGLVSETNALHCVGNRLPVKESESLAPHTDRFHGGTLRVIVIM